MELWQLLLGIAFFFAVLTFTYPLISRIRMRRERKDKEAEIIKIIREIRELKEKIEKEEGSLT